MEGGEFYLHDVDVGAETGQASVARLRSEIAGAPGRCHCGGRRVDPELIVEGPHFSTDDVAFSIPTASVKACSHVVRADERSWTAVLISTRRVDARVRLGQPLVIWKIS